MGVKLSLCMIVKDEQAVLARCLASAAELADEIVIADTGSRDNTKEIAKSFTDKVFDFAWEDDFSAARNFSFSKATGDYVMWLDADDVIEESELKGFLALKAALETERPDTVMCRYNTAFNEDGSPAFTYYRERILRRTPDLNWEGIVHECIAPRGKIVYADCAISHKKTRAGDPRRNLEIYQKAISRGHTCSAREKYYYGRELYYNRLYREAACVLEDALLDPALWKVNAAEACELLGDCYLYLRETEKALAAVFRAFSYGVPRAETLCAAGNIFKLKRDYESACYWYSLAAETPAARTDGFSRPEYRDFVPALELSVCCYHLGLYEDAKRFHEKAKALRPNHPSVRANERFFS